MQKKLFSLLIALAMVVSLIAPLGNVLNAQTDDGFIISEYIEGSSLNKAIELYNGTLSTLTLSNYKLALYSNGALFSTASVTLSGTLVPGDTYVIANSGADPAILAVADLINNSVINFNGDDAVALIRVADESYVDVFGQIGFDPGTYWGVSPNTTLDHTLVRKPNVVKGDSIGSDAFDPSIEWDFYPVNDFTHLGSHVMTTGSAPTLDWTGETGYESDGVEPSSGAPSTTFTYRVKYTDADNDAPLSGYPKVHILKSSVEISGSPFTMTEVDPLDTTYTDGKLYTYSTILSAGSDYTYYFEAKDANNASATGAPTSPQTGPTVSGDGVPPVIYGVKPYRMSVTYEVHPQISASYTDDDSGINASSAYLKVDNVDVTSEATVTSTGLTYTPPSDLAIGTHTVEVGVSDNAGNLKTLQWYFSIIEPLTTPNHYFGVPHVSSRSISIAAIFCSICGRSPRSVLTAAISSTTSIPSTTWPKAAYWPSRWGAAACIMKNCEPAESGCMDRAIEITPRVWRIWFGTPLLENSPLIW